MFLSIFRQSSVPLRSPVSDSWTDAANFLRIALCARLWLSSAFCCGFLNYSWRSGKLQLAAAHWAQATRLRLHARGRQAEHRPARRLALRAIEGRLAPRPALRRERCEREKEREREKEKKKKNSHCRPRRRSSDLRQCSACASSRASLLQEITLIVHQEPVFDPERHLKCHSDGLIAPV